MNDIVKECPLCKSPRRKRLDQRVSRGIQITNHVCLTCGAVYLNPRMDAGELETFYQEEYRRLYHGDAKPLEDALAVQQERAEAFLLFVKTNVSSIDRQLDIGSSGGLLLKVFQEQFGCQATGIEPGQAYRDYANQQGFTTYASLEEMKSKNGARFDFISMSHVLEHLPDPVEYLSKLRDDLLVENGSLFIEVPNLYAHESFEVAHLVSYSESTLRSVLQRAGFKVKAIMKHGKPHSEILPIYLSIIAQPGEHVAPPAERFVSFKRKWGRIKTFIISWLWPKKAWR